MKRVRIYRWRGRELPHGNFGDEITIPLLEKLFGIEAVPSRMREAELLGAGSILDAWTLRGPRRAILEMFATSCAEELHVWGSGLIMPGSEVHWPQRLYIHAVRGAMTAQRVAPDAPVGDPGILASLLLDKRPAQSCAVGFVPHYIDVDGLDLSSLPAGWRLIDPRQQVECVVQQIASCEFVVSSSLHGLIVSDSCGIPCVWAKSARRLYGGPGFKFQDYASTRGVQFNEPVTYAALERMNVEELSLLSSVPARSISEWQDELIAAFPAF